MERLNALQPLTYSEAMDLYKENGRRPFSFLAGPYLVAKTVLVMNGNVVASPTESAAAHYDWLALNRSARGAK